MTSNSRPFSVTIVAWLYIAVGAVGFFAHLPGLHVENALRFDGLGIELVECLAVISGAFMLRCLNWARWLALVWIAFHVVVSAFGAFYELAIHSLLCAVIALCLFRPEAMRYFRGAKANPETPCVS